MVLSHVFDRIKHRLAVHRFGFEVKIGDFALVWLVMLEGGGQDAVVAHAAPSALWRLVLFKFDNVHH